MPSLINQHKNDTRRQHKPCIDPNFSFTDTSNRALIEKTSHNTFSLNPKRELDNKQRTQIDENGLNAVFGIHPLAPCMAVIRTLRARARPATVARALPPPSHACAALAPPPVPAAAAPVRLRGPVMWTRRGALVSDWGSAGPRW